MRILTITYNDQGISWGPAIHFLELWNCMARAAPDAEILGLAPSWTGTAPIIKPDFKLKVVRVPDIPIARQVVYDFLAMICAVRERRHVDVLYIRVSQFHFFTILYSLIDTKKKITIELNGLLCDDARSARRPRLLISFVGWQEKMLVRRANAIIGVSAGIIDVIRDRYAPRGACRIIRNGVGTQFFNLPPRPAEPTHRQTMIYVGTYTSWDGSARIRDLAKRFPEVRFVMIGDGPGRQAVQRGAPDNLEFLGRKRYADLPAYYGMADAGIVLYEAERHARVEVSSLKTLEYLACGLPVFCTDVPGQGFIRDEGVGVLAHDSQIEKAFATFLRQLPDLRRRAAAYRGRMMAQHSWIRAAQDTAQAIAAVCR